MELLDDPHQLALTIIELRGYQRAYQQIEQAREHQRMDEPEGEMVERVHEINAELLMEERRGRG